jgi:signal transduction histidine kinase
MVLDLGSGTAISLRLGSPGLHVAFAMTLGLLFLVTLPLVTRMGVAAQAGLGRALLWDASALHRRISGLEQERDTARAQEALEELRALSRGIAPPILTDRGLPAALTALAGRSTVPAELEGDPPEGRLDAAVETAAYFVVAEALANVAKHSQAGRCAIGLRHDQGTLRAWVTDDGVGGAALDKGHGLRGLDDRVRAIGGRLRVTSPSGGPTTVTAELPCR